MDWRVVVSRHAAEQAAMAVHRDMGRGLFGLATVAATAPWLGIYLNLEGIFGSFGGINGDKTAIMAALAWSLSESVWPTAFGVALAVVAQASYRVFAARVDEMDGEMRCAILQLTNELARLRR